MKITKTQLRQIIKEEKARLQEAEHGTPGEKSIHDDDQLMDYWNQMLSEFGRQFPKIDTSYYGDKILAAMEEEYAAAAKEQREYDKKAADYKKHPEWFN
tara:strand:+ start:730 stop:1026 length:297 start_codon:yes stop_codon:yes gene_type:complete